ncbi:MAG TPA: hypothetical protein VF701_00465 [Thermoanaerobaculia bacterium]
MPGLATMTLVGIAVLVVLTVVFLKVRQKDLVGALIEKRRGSATIISRADYVEGMEKIPVALALVGNTIYYENPDLEASFDLDRVDEIEYDGSLVTSANVPDGCGVLRLRSHGAAFEFLLETGDCAKWAAALPPRTYGDTAQAV